MMSDYFRDARLENVTLNFPNFSNVQGDQYNNNTMIVTMTSRRRGFRIWRSKQEAEFEQYNEMKRGDIRLLRDISSYVPRRLKGRKILSIKCEKKIFTGEIVAGNGQSMRLTVVGYEGRDAQKEWLRDFKQYSRTLRANHVHLLAINRSRIPLLIFPGELVPAKHFMANVGRLGWAYFETLWRQMGCLYECVWMDAQRGVLCQGPRGPRFALRWDRSLPIEDVPSSVELLQEDVCLRFLAGCQSKAADRSVVINALSSAAHQEDIDLASNHPMVFSTLTNTPIAVATATWQGPLRNDASLVNGLTRFILRVLENEMFCYNKILSSQEVFSYSNEISLLTDPSPLGEAWLSQAWSVFHALGVSLEDDLRLYKLILPHFILTGSLSQSESIRQRRRRQQPIFLFIRPLPSTPLRSCTTPSLHYWSLEEDGRSPLSTDKCHHLGLPVALELRVEKPSMGSWSNETYRKIHQYQIARGFDPTTTDFARSIGYQYPAYKPPKDDSDRFEEVDVIEAEIDVVDTIQDTHHSSTYSDPTAPANKQSFSSRIKQWGHQLKL